MTFIFNGYPGKFSNKKEKSMPIWLNDSFLHNINMVSFQKKIKMEIMTYTFFFNSQPKTLRAFKF